MLKKTLPVLSTKKMELLKITLLLSIVIFVIISINNKVLTKRRVLYKHSKHHKHHKHHHNKVHHNNKQHGHHNLKLHHRQVTRIDPILESDLCKIGYTPRIVKGWVAKEESFSHVAALYHCEEMVVATSINDCEQVCGGSIISKFHILTAAHCVFENNTFSTPLQNFQMLVRIRVKDLLEKEINSGYYRTTFQIKYTFVHPKYHNDRPVPINDIALLKVEQPMIHGVPICIDGLHFNYDLKAKPNIVVAGWGAVSPDGKETIDLLKYAFLYISNNCSPYDAREFCSITPYFDGGYPCQGDSGSGALPLLQNGGAVNLIVGIASKATVDNSSGIPLCIPPSYFTNVTTYAKWINELVAVL